MKHNQEYIYALLLRKQLGELSEVEAAELQQVMQSDEQVRKCYQEQEEAKYYTNNEFLKDLRVEHDWLVVEAILKPKPIHVRIVRFLTHYRSLAAASFFGIAAVACAYLLRPVPRIQLPTAIQAPVKRPAVATPAPVVKHPEPAILVTTATAQADTVKRESISAGTSATDSSKLMAINIRRITHDTIYQSKSIEWNTLTVPPKTDYHLELSDGTEVHLNASSTLRFPFIFAGHTREVYLEGEAYFTVAHNPKQPFIVHTGTTSVIALGTAFNVNSYDNNVITTSLVQGSVVTDVGDSLDVTLRPGFEAIYKPGERFKVKRFDENVTLSWRDGIFRYVNKPLEDLAPVMMRWFGLKLKFSVPAIAKQTFTGELDKDKPVDEFLTDVCKELKLEYKIYGGTIYFLPYSNKKKDIMEE